MVLTFEQIAKRKNVEEEYVRYTFLDSLHQMLAEMETGGDYLFIHSLTNDWKRSGKSSFDTIYKDYFTIHPGRKNLGEIAEIRRLKVNTIEDHLVEIVLSDKGFSDFRLCDISRMRRKLLKRLRNLVQKSLKLSSRWSIINEISFFQIRLCTCENR